MRVLRTQLAGVARRPARLLLTGLAVLVVSFVVFATVLAQRITERSILNGLSGTPAAVDLVVRGGTATTAELAAIGRLAGVAEVVGRAEAGGQIGGEHLQIIADPGTGPLAVAHLAAGRYPAAAGEIAVTPRTAERMGLPVGTATRATLRHDANGKPLEATALTVVGLVTARDDYGFQAYAPQPLVTAMSGENLLRQIDLRLAPGADKAAVRDQVDAVLTAAPAPSAVDDRPQVETGADVRHAEAEQRANDVNTVFVVIGMFLAVAVIAAGLVVTSTFRIVFAQRMRQLALLRAVGAGRRAITWSLAAEGALTGLVTGVAGVLLAIGAGHL
ncbi:MAG TPA: ABC transporter permease, partial [Actinoplanes sp.]